MLKLILQFIFLPFPWPIRKWALATFFNFHFSKNSKIGKSIILAQEVFLEENASIGNFTLCKPINKLQIGKNSNIGNLCLINGFPVGPQTYHFLHRTNRKCELIIGNETGITSRHCFDCSGGIYIGDYCQIAGYGSTFLTHSIDLQNARQDAEPIKIGNYCFIGVKTTMLKGISIADKIAVGACSVITKNLNESESLYAGQPAKFIKHLENYKFFSRTKGAL